jgi:hypothetical protein
LSPEKYPDLSAEELQAAQERQDAMRNKAEAGVYYAETLKGQSDFSPLTDPNDWDELIKDPAWIQAQKAIEGVDWDEQTLESAKEDINKMYVAEGSVVDGYVKGATVSPIATGTDIGIRVRRRP